ncbi:MAG: hypothetical protein JWO08_1225 [Verrucomicrobiaceae bacterium]|nr:hypothetical protein [Verrucomicrobiaceae bacterium]
MDRIGPTDPPDEPVNRVAGAIAKMEAKAGASLARFSQEQLREEIAKLARMREDFAALLNVYHTDPQGNHRAAVQYATTHFNGPKDLLFMLRMIAQKHSDPLTKVMIEVLFDQEDFAHHAAIVPLIIRDLEKPETGP